MKLITLLLPESHIKGLDRLVHEKKMYANRAQAIREAIRDLLKVELWEKKDFPTVSHCEGGERK